MMFKKIAWFILGFVSGMILISTINFFNKSTISMFAPAPKSEDTKTEVVTKEASIADTKEAQKEQGADTPKIDTKSATGGLVTVSDQSAGNTVLVANVTLPQDGWIVVHEERNGVVANALGAVRRDAGTHTDVLVKLLRPTLAGKTYWIIPYKDNGDRKFDLKTDFPLRTDQDKLEMYPFKTR